jgi:hypothetical protein
MASPADDALLALMKLSSEERLGVLELLPEWQRLTRPNDLRSTVRREVIEAIIDVAVRAQKHHAAGGGDPLHSLLREARLRAASHRLDEKEKRPP